LKKSGSANRFEREFSQTMQNVEEVLGKVSKPRKVERDIAARTGLPSLDVALGGGFPSGLVEIFGGMSVGKTATVASIIKQAQRDRMEVAYAPTETQEGPYLERCGVDLSNLAVITGREPDALQECCLDFLQTGSRRMLVLDSLNAVRPYDQGHFDWNMWAYSFLMDMKELLPFGSVLVVTGQVRSRWSPDGRISGGEESASRSVTDLFDVRLELVRGGIGEEAYDLVVNVVANTNRQPGVFVELEVEKGYGLDREADVLRVGVALGLIERSGRFFYVDGRAVAGSTDEMKKKLRMDPGMMKYIVDKALAKWA